MGCPYKLTNVRRDVQLPLADEVVIVEGTNRDLEHKEDEAVIALDVHKDDTHAASRGMRMIMLYWL